MKVEFEGVVTAGHKGDAVEAPFDPAREWGSPMQRLWNGRNGHFVKATINGVQFESAVVPRMKKHFLLIDEEATAAANITIGETIYVAIEPLAAPTRFKQ